MTIVRRSKRARYPFEEMIPRLEEWLDTPLGQRILQQEHNIIDQKTNQLFGYHLLQLSISRHIQLAEQCMIRHRFALTPRLDGAGTAGAVAELSSLPLETDSIDVVLLHHVLEYSQSPHQLLREAARITVQHGHLIIVGFNPVSLLGIWSMVSGRLPHTVWQNRLIGMGRLFDWLSLLDLTVLSVDYCFYPPPLKQPALLNRLQGLDRTGQRLNLPFGGCYVLVAKKETATLTPHKPRWMWATNFVTGIESRIYSHKVPKKNTLH